MSTFEKLTDPDVKILRVQQLGEDRVVHRGKPGDFEVVAATRTVTYLTKKGKEVTVEVSAKLFDKLNRWMGKQARKELRAKEKDKP